MTILLIIVLVPVLLVGVLAFVVTQNIRNEPREQAGALRTRADEQKQP